MSGDKRTVKITFLGDATDLAKASKEGSSHLGKIGAAAKVAGVAAAAALGTFAVSAVKVASDVNESQSKVNTVFGKSSRVIDDFAADAAKKLGQSRGDVLEAAGTFGNLFTALGITQKAAAGMSTQAVQLATDLGSFNNASAPEALEAIKSGLLGEAEPLKKFGVNLSAARVEAEAFAIGLAKPVKNAAAITAANNKVTQAVGKLAEAQKKHGKNSLEAKLAQDAVTKAQDALAKATKGAVPPLTAAQKAQAAYSVILKDTKTAQGDFARTSSGMANQTKIAQARFKDLQATVGAKLLPVVNKAIAAGLKMADWLEKNRKAIVPLVAVLGGLAVGIWAVNAAAKAYRATQAALNIVMSMNPIGLVIIAIAALVAGLIYAYKHSEKFRTVVNGAFHAVADAATWMWDKVLRPTFKFLADAWLTVAGTIIHTAAKAFGWVPGLGGKLKQAAKEFDHFRDQVNNALDGIHDKTIKVKIDTYANTLSPGDLKTGRHYAAGTRGAAAGMALVGEHGPELVEFRGGERVHTAQATRSTGGRETFLGTVQLVLDGKVIQTALLRLKRNGGGELGLA